MWWYLGIITWLWIWGAVFMMAASTEEEILHKSWTWPLLIWTSWPVSMPVLYLFYMYVRRQERRKKHDLGARRN